LNGLEAVGQLDLLQQLYSTIDVPEAVAQECGSSLPAWCQVRPVTNQSLVQTLKLDLGAGEAEAIALSVECSASRLILDDKKAGDCAATQSARNGNDGGFAACSSTFRDMHAERDYLVKVVLPRLRQWCEKRRLHLGEGDTFGRGGQAHFAPKTAQYEPVPDGSGVTKEDADHGKAIEICLQEIDALRP